MAENDAVFTGRWHGVDPCDRNEDAGPTPYHQPSKAATTPGAAMATVPSPMKATRLRTWIVSRLFNCRPPVLIRSSVIF